MKTIDKIHYGNSTPAQKDLTQKELATLRFFVKQGIESEVAYMDNHCRAEQKRTQKAIEKVKNIMTKLEREA